MSTFHKPKIYRSPRGCCICGTKSSSSRFTDSKRYEDDFLRCFRLERSRTGEICNACVLNVKRWKELPKEDSVRHWGHVVDSRAGPGAKNIHKGKKRKIVIHSEETFPNGWKKPVYKTKRKTTKPMKLSGSLMTPSKKPEIFSGFIDQSYFKRKEICCGIIYVGLKGEVLVDERFFGTCSSKTHNGKKTNALQAIENMVTAELREFDYEGFYNDVSSRASKTGVGQATDVDQGFSELREFGNEDFYNDNTKRVAKMGARAAGDVDHGFSDKSNISPDGLKFEDESSQSFKF